MQADTISHIIVFFSMFGIGSLFVFAGTIRVSDGYEDYYFTQGLYWLFVLIFFFIAFKDKF